MTLEEAMLERDEVLRTSPEDLDWNIYLRSQAGLTTRTLARSAEEVRAERARQHNLMEAR